MTYVPRSFGSTLLLPNGTLSLSTTAQVLFRTGKHRALKSIIRAEIQHLNISSRREIAHMNSVLRSEVQHIKARFLGGPMSNPYTTIDVSVTVTDQNNFVVSNLTSCALTITFPDGTTQGPISTTNLGNGVYSATYTTKSPGLTREVWGMTDPSGATAQFLNINPVSY